MVLKYLNIHNIINKEKKAFIFVKTCFFINLRVTCLEGEDNPAK